MSERLRREIARIDPVQCADIDDGYCLVNKKYCCNVTACDIKNPREKVLVSPELNRERCKKARQKKADKAKSDRETAAIEKDADKWLAAQDINEMSKGELTKEVIRLNVEMAELREVVDAIVERWNG